MKQLIDLFNKKYGKQYGVIDDSFSNEDTYKIYKIIKTLCSDDEEIMTVLEKVKLPEPKTAKESIEKININVSSGVGNDNVPHYKETLIFEISGEDYGSFYNNSYFNMDTLNLDETKSYVGKNKSNMDSPEEFIHMFVYDKEADALMDEENLVYIYNHKSFNGTDFIEDENSAVLTFDMKPMGVSEVNGYFRLYEIDKVELDNNCLSSDLTIKNSLTVGNRIGDIGEYSVSEGYQNTASSYCSHAEGYSTTASDYASHAEGGGTTASGTFSHAEGAGTTASGYASHAEGDNATVLGDSSHIEGKSSNSATSVIQNLSSSTSNDDILIVWKTSQFSLAKGEASHVEGKNCLALGDNSHAEGYYNTATGNTSHAEGYCTTANGNVSHVEGLNTTASGTSSHAEGGETTAIGDYSHAEGSSSNSATSVIQDLSSSTSNDSIITAWNSNKFSLTKGTASHVEGKDNLALGDYSHAEGGTTAVSGIYSHAEGWWTTASGGHSHAEGGSTTASGIASHAEGESTTASGNCSHAEGEYAKASGTDSHAEGYETTASGYVSHAEGSYTTASGDYSHAEGLDTTASGSNSHAEGSSSNSASGIIQNLSSSTTNDLIMTNWETSKFSLAKGEGSHVEGKDCLALGVSSHAEGEGTTASGDYSHAEGNNTSASNSYCHSEGNSTKATGKTSHAEGSGTTASGNCSHSEGFKTNSIGRNSHAEGDSTTASGSNSHTEGTNTVSNGDNSHTEGLGTKAQGHQQHVQGKYNIVNTSYAHIVGNGASDTSRSNAHTLDWNGNAWYSGKLSQDGVPTEDKDLATKKYVDDKTALSTDVKNTLPSNGLLTLTTDKIQTTTLAVPTDITLPTVTGYTEIHLFFEGSEGVTITTGTTTVRWKTSPTISIGNLYEIVFTYINDTIGWIGDCLSYSA